MTEAEQSYTNGTINEEEDESSKVRPADIEAVNISVSYIYLCVFY